MTLPAFRRGFAPAGYPLLGERAFRGYWRRVRNIFGGDLIGYWPLWEPSGVTAYDISGRGHHGVHTGVTLGETGIGDGHTSPLYDGTNDFTNIYSAGLGADFNGAEGTLMIWAKVANAGVWTDGTFDTPVDFKVDVSNRVVFSKRNVDNRTQCFYIAGGTTDSVVITMSLTGWFSLAMTWSASNDEVIVYLDGVQSGATQTGLGTWAGEPGTALIGSEPVAPFNPWSGNLAYAALGARALTPAQILSLSTV